jgi:putative transposase
MTYNPAKHHRRSIRLKGHDYSQPGAYFITICTQNRQWLFGEIIGGKMVLNDAGKMIEKWYFEIENKFSVIKCTDHVTMPNHFHCIIEIPIPPVGMALCGHPNPESPNGHPNPGDASDARANPDAHIGASLRERASIFEIMDWFKTMTTNEYIRGVKSGNWQRFEKRVWQLRYWDHIVRNEKELFAIRQYIKSNPSNWEYDKLNGGTGNRVLEESGTYGEESWMI